jgi:hypothetical protein
VFGDSMVQSIQEQLYEQRKKKHRQHAI